MSSLAPGFLTGFLHLGSFFFLAHKGGDAEEESSPFPEYQAPRSQGGIHSHSLLDLHLAGDKYKEHPDSLF